MIQTSRLILRDFVLSDFDAVHEYAADPLVTRFTGFGPNTTEETRNFLARSVAASSVIPRQNYTFAVIEQDSGRLIGGCGLEQCDGTGQHYTFGMCFTGTGGAEDLDGKLPPRWFNLGLTACEPTGFGLTCFSAMQLRRGFSKDSSFAAKVWRFKVCTCGTPGTIS